MRIPTISADASGGSYLRESELELKEADFAPPSPSGYRVSPALDAEGLHILSIPKGYVDAWHPAPSRLLAIALSGRLRLETSDGGHLIIETGGLFILEDTWGKGHLINETEGHAYELALIRLSAVAQS